MKNPLFAKLMPVALGLLGVVLFLYWVAGDVDLELREPGGDGRPATVAVDEGPIKIEGTLTAMDGTESELAGSWPRFRGDDFDAIRKTDVRHLRSWPDAGPTQLWSVDMGEGFAGAAIHGGRVYVLDYDRQNKADVLRCMSLDDGKDIWQYSYPVYLSRRHGMSRTVPAVTDEYVVTVGPKCHVTCLDAVTGEFRWMYNLVREFGTKVPRWYTAQCPLIEGGRAIIAPAGDEVLMMAIDCESGEIVWKAPNPDKWEHTESSIVPMEFGGKRFYVYCGTGGVAGVSADDGSILWTNTEWKMMTNVPMPVVVGDDRIFLTAGYGQYDLGCAMLRLGLEGEKITAKTEFLHPTEVFGSMQQTPVLYKDHIYGVGMDKQLACLDLEGNVLWRSSSANKFGHGPYMIADGILYIMDDDGLLRLVEPSTSGYKELDQAQVIDEAHEAWAPMAIAAGRLILRDLTRMVCLDVKAP